MKRSLPIFGTIASQFNDPGMNRLYKAVMQQLTEKANADLVSTLVVSQEMDQKVFVVPPSRVQDIFSEIAEKY